jgi:hypothetical protein
MGGFLATVLSLGLMALGTGSSIWYLTRISKGHNVSAAEARWPPPTRRGAGNAEQ